MRGRNGLQRQECGRNRGCCRLGRGLHQPNGFAFELRGESLTLLHRTPPSGDCPRFVVSEKSGVIQVHLPVRRCIVWNSRLLILHEGIPVAHRRHERLLDAARADPAQEVEDRAGLVVGAGCATDHRHSWR